MKLVLAITTWIAMTAIADAAPRHRLAVERQLARDFVLATCLAQKYQGSPIGREAEIWTGGLVEHGSVPADVYVKLTEFVKQNAPEPQESKAGVTMLLESCIRLYNSKATRDRVRALVRR